METNDNWICNECNFPNLTGSVPAYEIEQELHACINCGGFEFHKNKLKVLELKELIKRSEERLVSYKKLFEEIFKDKINFPIDCEHTIWYKSLLRDLKNQEEIILKRLVEEKTYENEKLNPPHFYKY